MIYNCGDCSEFPYKDKNTKAKDNKELDIFRSFIKVQ